jgi:hypothetical protein
MEGNKYTVAKQLWARPVFVFTISLLFASKTDIFRENRHYVSCRTCEVKIKTLFKYLCPSSTQNKNHPNIFAYLATGVVFVCWTY